MSTTPTTPSAEAIAALTETDAAAFEAAIDVISDEKYRPVWRQAFGVHLAIETLLAQTTFAQRLDRDACLQYRDALRSAAPEPVADALRFLAFLENAGEAASEAASVPLLIWRKE